VRKEDEVDVRTDIYGLGSILYSLLTLRRPLSGDLQEVLAHTVNGAIVPPADRTPDRAVPRALDAVTMKAMHVNPARRYGSVIELRTEVHRFLTGYATEAERAGVGTQFALFYRRNRMFCNAVFCSLILLLGGGAWTFIQVSEARKEAEHTLALYEAGQSELENVSAENVQSIVNLGRRLWRNSEFDRAQAILETALRDNPGNPVLMREMGISYFIMQRFSEALPWLEQGTHSDDVVVRLAGEYAGLKTDPADILPVEQMTGLLAGLDRHDPLREWVVLGDQRKRFNLNERAQVIETYFRLINPGWKGGRFNYDEESNRLVMGGTGLKKLSAVLAGLNLRELDISGSEVSNLWKLQNLAVERLDVHATQVREIWPIKRMIYLRELVIHEGQFPVDQLNVLSDRLEVIERPRP
jgi:serine/threonine-protein kinase